MKNRADDLIDSSDMDTDDDTLPLAVLVKRGKFKRPEVGDDDDVPLAVLARRGMASSAHVVAEILQAAISEQ